MGNGQAWRTSIIKAGEGKRLHVRGLRRGYSTRSGCLRFPTSTNSCRASFVATGERSFAWSGQVPGCRKHHRFARFSALTTSPHITDEVERERERSRGCLVVAPLRERFPWTGSYARIGAMSLHVYVRNLPAAKLGVEDGGVGCFLLVDVRKIGKKAKAWERLAGATDC